MKKKIRRHENPLSINKLIDILEKSKNSMCKN